MNWQTIKQMNSTLDRILLWIWVFIILSYPLEWLIRYLKHVRFR
jgi:hypothetical protein